MGKFIEYLKETKAEMAHVSWPTREQTIQYTILVIVLSLVSAAFLGLLDAGFTYALEKLLLR